MFEVTADNKIKLTRGDYACFDIEIYDYDDTPYVPEAGDVVTFTVKRSVSAKDHLIQKEGTTVEILGEDTEELNYGRYYYDVQLTHANGHRDTFITPTEFYVTEEVTW